MPLSHKTKLQREAQSAPKQNKLLLKKEPNTSKKREVQQAYERRPSTNAVEMGREEACSISRPVAKPSMKNTKIEEEANHSGASWGCKSLASPAFKKENCNNNTLLSRRSSKSRGRCTQPTTNSLERHHKTMESLAQGGYCRKSSNTKHTKARRTCLDGTQSRSGNRHKGKQNIEAQEEVRDTTHQQDQTLRLHNSTPARHENEKQNK